MSGSEEASVRPCACAWQTSIRSKGSRCSAGRRSTFPTAASSSASGAMRCFSRCRGMNCAGGCGSGSLPRPCLTEISQNETALRKTSLSGSRIAVEKRGGKFCVAGDEPEEFAGIQQDFHLPSNARRMSSGSGALKSSGTMNCPRARPAGRGCDDGAWARMVSRPEAFSGRLSAPFGRMCPWSISTSTVWKLMPRTYAPARLPSSGDLQRGADIYRLLTILPPARKRNIAPTAHPARHAACLRKAPLQLLPVLDHQSVHAGKLACVVRDEHQPRCERVSGDEHDAGVCIEEILHASFAVAFKMSGMLAPLGPRSGR